MAKFLWLAETGESRRGKKLVRGQVHDAGDVPAEVLAEWVKTGAAEMVKEVAVDAAVEVKAVKSPAKGSYKPREN